MIVQMRKTNIYDDGATVIESVSSVKNKTPVKSVKRARKATAENKNEVNIEDVITAAFSYFPPRMSIMEDSEEHGTCKLCGKETTNPMRVICYDCMMSRAAEIYKKTKDAINNGEKKIEMEQRTD